VEVDPLKECCIKAIPNIMNHQKNIYMTTEVVAGGRKMLFMPALESEW
jgi:hypothetical protein